LDTTDTRRESIEASCVDQSEINRESGANNHGNHRAELGLVFFNAFLNLRSGLLRE
jgi:hypothetical protein